jgi:flagellar hook protein FlgE
MLRSLDSGVSGLTTQMSFMDNLSNNIANVSTTGYKATRVRFSDLIYQTMSSGSAGTSGGPGGTNPVQMGLGVQLAGTDNTMTQGALTETGNPLDLAIEGNGFFIVNDAAGASHYTRDGAFQLDSSGNLVDPSTGNLVQGAGGNINIDMTKYVSVNIGPDGTINAVDATGTSTKIDTLQLATFPNAAGLIRVGSNDWDVSPASGAATTGAAQSANFGTVREGTLEESNVNLAEEFANMVKAERGFEANSKTITTSDAILQTLISMKQAP